MEKTITIDGCNITVSDDGKKVLVNGKPKKILRFDTGYCYITAENKTFLVHRLVAHAFIQPLKRGDRTIQVHHIDEDKTNNSVENLQVMTMAEHQRLHKQIYEPIKVCIVCGKEYEAPLRHRKRSKVCSMDCWYKFQKQRGLESKKKIAQYDLQGNFLKMWDSATDIERELGFAGSNICKCCKKVIPYAYGYKWRYGDAEEYVKVEFSDVPVLKAIFRNLF